MAEKIIHGVKAVKIGTVAENGEMPTTLTEEFRTYRDSVSFIEEEGQETPEFCDQDDDPIISFTESGAKKLKMSLFDYTPALLKKLKGGTVLGNKWSAPTKQEDVYLSFLVETDDGGKIGIVNGKVKANLNMEIKKKGMSLLEVVVTPLSPGKGKSPYFIETSA